VNLVSCGPKKNKVLEIRDSKLVIHLTKISAERGAGDVAYKCKIIPLKIAGYQDFPVRNQMIYHMDSCFYLLKNHEKSYSVFVQPVANGIKGTFEYLLQWHVDDNANTGTVSLIFNDKYLYSRIYTFKIKD
jgi:hypothetical protein